jgi:hypothetical protein
MARVNGRFAQPSSSASRHSLSLIRGDAEPIKNQAAEPAATAPPSAAMICMIQEALPSGLVGGETAAVGAGSACCAGALVPADAASPAGGFVGAKLYNATPLAGVAVLLAGGGVAGALAGAFAGVLGGALGGVLGRVLGSLAARSISLASSGERTCTA